MRYMCILAVAAVLFASSALAFAADDSDAAQCYVAGDTAYQAGNLDEAISQWQQALKLKPSSSLTKDRLIEALTKKVAQLTDALAKSESQPHEVVIKTASNPAPVDNKILPANQYTPEAINSIWTNKMTQAQREAYWNSLQGYKVVWPGVIKDVKQSGVGGYEVALTCGPCNVKLTCKLTEQQAVSLNVGRKVTLRGVLGEHKSGTYYMPSGEIW